MTENLHVLGQIVPSASALTPLYTVPIATFASVSSVIVCNQNNINEIVFRISIAVSGATDAPNQYIYYDMPLSPNDTFITTVGLTLAAGDIIRVMSDTGNVSFSLFGVEVT